MPQYPSVTIDGGKPRVLSMKDAIACYIEHRRDVLRESMTRALDFFGLGTGPTHPKHVDGA